MPKAALALIGIVLVAALIAVASSVRQYDLDAKNECVVGKLEEILLPEPFKFPISDALCTEWQRVCYGGPYAHSTLDVLADARWRDDERYWTLSIIDRMGFVTHYRIPRALVDVYGIGCFGRTAMAEVKYRYKFPTNLLGRQYGTLAITKRTDFE